MNRLPTLAALLLLVLCQACQQQPATPPTTNTIDSTAITKQPITDSIDPDAKQPFEYDIDTLYHGQAPNPSTGYYGEFGGDEPMWRLNFKGKKLVWLSATGTNLEEKVTFANEANVGFLVGFKSAHLYGVVSRSLGDTCFYSIYDAPYLPMEIYFSADGETYGGCGILKGVDLRR